MRHWQHGRCSVWMASVVAVIAIALLPHEAFAYVGPGAGIRFRTPAATLVTSAVGAFFLILVWPFRQLFLAATRKRPPQAPRIRRAIVVGLDGLDPDLVTRFMAEGRLPAMSRLAAHGTFRKLGTTFP